GSANSLVYSTWTYRNLVINGPGGSFLISGGSLTVNESLTLTAGSLDTGISNNYAIGVSSNWINNGGTFIAELSTVTFLATTPGHTITSNGSAFNNLQFNGTSGKWTLQDPLIVSSTLTI